jgi:hypothetical protein
LECPTLPPLPEEEDEECEVSLDGKGGKLWMEYSSRLDISVALFNKMWAAALDNTGGDLTRLEIDKTSDSINTPSALYVSSSSSFPSFPSFPSLPSCPSFPSFPSFLSFLSFSYGKVVSFGFWFRFRLFLLGATRPVIDGM